MDSIISYQLGNNINPNVSIEDVFDKNKDIDSMKEQIAKVYQTIIALFDKVNNLENQNQNKRKKTDDGDEDDD